MDPESKKILQDTFALVEDNNKMLHHIRRSQRMASFMRAFYWIIIIGVSIGSFYYLEPYFNKVISLYNSISGTEQQLNSSSVGDLLKKLGQ